MKVAELHPEDLIDKLSAGELSPAESDRLHAHLAQCAGCRFEVGVRVDLSREAPRTAERPQLWFSQAAGGARSAPPNATQFELGEPDSRFHSAHSRRRWPVAMLAAALLMAAGGAAAAVLSGAIQPPWQRGPTQSSVVSPPSSSGKSRVAKRALPEPLASAPASEDAELPLAPTNDLPVVPVIESEPAASGAVSPRRTPRSRTSLTGVPVGAQRASESSASESSESARGPGPLPPLSSNPAASLFVEANRARRDGNADRAVTLYRSLQARFPNSSESKLSRALLGQLLLERGSPEAALAGFDHYLTESTPVLAAEAWVGRARALEQLGKQSLAAAAWQQVQRRFPGSVHARLAATRLAALGSR